MRVKGPGARSLFKEEKQRMIAAQTETRVKQEPGVACARGGRCCGTEPLASPRTRTDNIPHAAATRDQRTAI